jgi:hypothetical protein
VADKASRLPSGARAARLRDSDLQPTPGLRDADEGRRQASDHAATGKTEEVWQAENDFRTGFLVDSGGDRPAGRDRQETARFPRASSSNPADPPRLPSHTFCVGTLDLASVSMTVRSISNSVRRTHSPVSTNVRQKTPLIARRPHFDCAPLQVAGSRAGWRSQPPALPGRSCCAGSARGSRPAPPPNRRW